MPPFWVGLSKQRKKPGSRRSSNCVQNAFFQLSPSGRNEKTPLGSNFTISVSWHHFGWAYPSSGKSRVDEGRPIAFKTSFFNFPHRGETKKHPWDRILQFRFHATILGGLIQAAEKAGLTKVVQLRSKRVFSTFPIGAKRKNTLGIEFYNFGFMPPFWVGLSKQRKKPGWRRSSNCAQNVFFQLSPSGRNEKTPLGSNFTISVSWHHFGWAYPSSGKSRVDEGRPIAFKTSFFNFAHRGETKKHPWDRILQFRFHATILGGLIQAAEKAGLTKVVQLRSKLVFSTFPSGRNEKTPLGSNFTISVSWHHFGWAYPSSGKSRVDEGRPIAFETRFFNFPHLGETLGSNFTISVSCHHFGWAFPSSGKSRVTKVVQLRSKRVFSTFPSGRNEKTPLGSNFTISVSWHHFGWAYPSSGKSRVDEGRPIAFKTRFFNFAHRGETKKHPWDRILQFRFPATILGGLIQAAEKAGLTKVVQLRSKRVFSTFPIGAKRKNTLGIEFYNFGFMAPFWVGLSKQRKKPGWRRSSNCVQNAFFQLSPSGRNEKTPLGSNFTISVSCHHFGWAYPSSGKSRVDEGRPIAFKTRFFNFPHRGETKKHPWDRILQFRFHGTILGGLIQAAEKAGLTKVVQLRSKRRFFNFPHRGETKKHPWDRILQFRFHGTILGGLIQAAEKAGLTKVVQLRSKRVFSTFPIGAKRKNTLGIEFYNFGFMPPFWVGLSKQRKKPGWRRSSNCVQNAFFQLSPSGRNEKTPLGSNFTISVSWHHFGWAYPSSGKSRVDEGRPIAFKTRFFNFPHRGETKKHPWDRILQFRFHATILGGLIQAAEKAGLTKVVQLRSKLVFSTFPIGAKRKKTPLGSNFTISLSCHHFGWAFQAAEKAGFSSVSLKTVFSTFPSETKKHPWDRILQFRFHGTILGGLIQAAEKAGLTKVVQLRSKRVFSTFPIGAKRKNTLGIEFYNFGFMPPFWVGLSKQRKKPGYSKSSRFPHRVDEGGSNCVQNVVFSTLPIGAKRKNTLGIEFYNFGFMPPFWVGLSKQRKKPGWRRSSNCVQNAFFQLSPSGRNEKTPLGSNFTISVSCHHFGWAFPSSGKSRVDEGRPIAFKTRFFNFPHRGETKKHPWDRILQFRFHATILGGLFQAAEKPGWRRSSNCVQNCVFSTFPIGAKRKNTLGIEFYNFGFMAPFWVGLSKQRKKPGWRRSSNCVQKLSPSGRNEKTRLGSNFTTVSCHHFGWAFPSSGKSRVYEGRRIKTCFFNFPIGIGIEFYNFGFMAPFWVGLSKQRKKPGWRRSSNCVQNAFFQLSPSGRNEKTPLGSNFTISVSCHHFGWAFPSSGKSRVDEGRPIAFKTRFFNFPHRGETKKHPWDRILQFRFPATILGGLFQAAEKAGLTKVVQLRSKLVFSTFPSGRNEKTPLGSNFTISVSWHHFGWAYPSSGKSRVDEGRPIAFKTRFFNFPHRGETKKHPWDRILQFRFHATILGGLIQAAEKAGLTKVVQLRSKRVFSTFPIGAKRKNTLGIEFYNFGFMAPFWVGLSKQRKKPGWRRSSNCVQNAFFNFPHRGETKKHPWDRILQFRFHATILGGLIQAAEKAGLTKVVQLRSKRVFSTFPIGAKRKNTLGI